MARSPHPASKWKPAMDAAKAACDYSRSLQQYHRRDRRLSLLLLLFLAFLLILSAAACLLRRIHPARQPSLFVTARTDPPLPRP